MPKIIIDVAWSIIFGVLMHAVFDMLGWRDTLIQKFGWFGMTLLTTPPIAIFWLVIRK